MRKTAFQLLCMLCAFSGFCQPGNPEEVLLSLPGTADSVRQLQLKSVAIYSAIKLKALENNDTLTRERPNKKSIVFKVEYDKNGNKTSKISYDEAGNIQNKITSILDDNGRLVKLTEEGAFGQQSSEYTYKLGKNNTIVEKTMVRITQGNEYDDIENSQTERFDERGNLIERLSWLEDSLTSRLVLEYDKNNKGIKKTTYSSSENIVQGIRTQRFDEHNNITYSNYHYNWKSNNQQPEFVDNSMHYVYNTRGQLLEKRQENNSTRRYWRYAYDKRGNQVSLTSNSSGRDKTVRFDYDANNNRVKVWTEGAPDHEAVHFEYTIDKKVSRRYQCIDVDCREYASEVLYNYHPKGLIERVKVRLANQASAVTHRYVLVEYTFY